MPPQPTEQTTPKPRYGLILRAELRRVERQVGKWLGLGRLDFARATTSAVVSISRLEPAKLYFVVRSLPMLRTLPSPEFGSVIGVGCASSSSSGTCYSTATISVRLASV
jgi:hypothetical protein